MHGANHDILKPLGIENCSIERHGPIPVIKELAYRLMNKPGLLKTGKRNASNVSDLILDIEHPEGMSKREEKEAMSFACAD